MIQMFVIGSAIGLEKDLNATSVLCVKKQKCGESWETKQEIKRNFNRGATAHIVLEVLDFRVVFYSIWWVMSQYFLFDIF